MGHSPLSTNQCSANNNPNAKRATNYDYLDYGAYINRVLSAQLSAHTTSDPINWNLPRTSDKVNMVNAMLQILESKKLYESLLAQSRDTINALKSEVHSSESKNQQLHSHNKQLSARIKTLLQRKEQMEQTSKRKESAWKDKLKSAQKEIEGLAYRDKTYQHNMRRQEKVHKAQQEKIKKLLDDRDKKSYRVLGMKLLNAKGPSTTMSMNGALSKSRPKSATNSNSKASEEAMNAMRRAMEEKAMLSSELAHLQKQLSSVLSENNLLRESLLRLEVNCKESLLKINDLFADGGNEVRVVRAGKYAMVFDRDAQGLVDGEIEESVRHLGEVLDELKSNIDQTNNKGNIERLQGEVVRLKATIRELEETNKEYETLIRTYVNNE